MAVALPSTRAARPAECLFDQTKARSPAHNPDHQVYAFLVMQLDILSVCSASAGIIHQSFRFVFI